MFAGELLLWPAPYILVFCYYYLFHSQMNQIGLVFVACHFLHSTAKQVYHSMMSKWTSSMAVKLTSQVTSQQSFMLLHSIVIMQWWCLLHCISIWALLQVKLALREMSFIIPPVCRKSFWSNYFSSVVLLDKGFGGKFVVMHISTI